MNNDKEFRKHYPGIYPQSNTYRNLNGGLYDTTNVLESSLNPKQIFWIKRRKLRREALDSQMVENNMNYLHESRHRHAMKRMRGPSGRFLTKEETLEQLKNSKENTTETL